MKKKSKQTVGKDSHIYMTPAEILLASISLQWPDLTDFCTLPPPPPGALGWEKDQTHPKKLCISSLDSGDSALSKSGMATEPLIVPIDLVAVCWKLATCVLGLFSCIVWGVS